MNLSENGVLCTVSKEFREAAEGDAIWREAYEKRFPNKGEVNGYTLKGGPDAAAGSCVDGHVCAEVATAASPSARGKEKAVDEGIVSFKNRYEGRLQDPHVRADIVLAQRGSGDVREHRAK